MSAGGRSIDSMLLKPSALSDTATSSSTSSTSTASKDAFITKLMQNSALTTHISNAIPTGSNFAYNMTFHEFASAANDCSSDIKDLFGTIFEFIGGEYSNKDFTNNLSDADASDKIIDMIDRLLEDTDLRLDAVMGHKKAAGTISLSTAVDKETVLVKNSRDMRKPQLEFSVEVDNSRLTPFQPKLTKKHNSNIQLSRAHVPLDLENKSLVAPSYYYAHPYNHEISTLSFNDISSKSLSTLPNLNPWLPSPDQPFEFIDDLDSFSAMVDALKIYDEVAIDLEHHSYRSYQGFTCLIQISSRYRDYIVDAIKIRHCISELNVITTNPKIVKVFHGSEGDILWLQKDFGVYVVNCFDSFHAAKLLRYPALSLAHLLKLFCGVTTNKTLQLADWRERPLSRQMIEYAKSDTHHLLYIYDHLRKEVFSAHGRDGLELVFDASRRTCLKRYEKEYFNPLGYKKLLEPDMIRRYAPALSKQEFTSTQESVLAALYDWRDSSARKEDESVIYIMSNAEMLKIAYHLPTNVRDLESSCGPLAAFSKSKSEDLLHIVSNALDVSPQLQKSVNNSLASRGAESSGKYNQQDFHLRFQPNGHKTIAQLNPRIEVDLDSLMSKYDISSGGSRGGGGGVSGGVRGDFGGDVQSFYTIIKEVPNTAGMKPANAVMRTPKLQEAKEAIESEFKTLIGKLLLSSSDGNSRKRNFSEVDSAKDNISNGSDNSSDSDSNSNSNSDESDSAEEGDSRKQRKVDASEEALPLSFSESYNLSKGRRRIGKHNKQEESKPSQWEKNNHENEANAITASNSTNSLSNEPSAARSSANFDFSQIPGYASVGSLLSKKTTTHREDREKAREKYKNLNQEEMDKSLSIGNKNDEGLPKKKEAVGANNPYLQAIGRNK